MQELIRRRRRAGFVGRRTELADFRSNFATAPEDERRRFLFNVHGDAGVGKTLLVEQFQRVARDEMGAVVARADEKSEGLVATLESLVQQLAPRGAARHFDKALASYRQQQLRDAQVSADPTATGPSAGGRIAAGVGLAMVQSLPVVGPLASAVSAEEVSQAAHRVGAVLGERSHAADSLLLDPAEALTPPFVELLRRLAGEVPWLALFFDTYERTEVFLGTWLLDLVEGRYGDLPANMVLTVAGQHRLHPGAWAPIWRRWRTCRCCLSRRRRPDGYWQTRA
ncbi:ATP-binding protein [Streptomyces sp. 3213.3]|uniref:ATP-binding protein n=1 Tax=Streptomyces sp. 3213.3 TaxID=1855348 RepID=UPI0010426570|nr:ATP-binding protein [Streptomyces sp. 3213.3]